MQQIHNNNKKDEDVQHVRDWLNKQPHLPQITDVKLVMFLHSCRYNRELTKTTIDTYFTMKTVTPEFFSERDPLSEEMQSTSSVVMLSPLPKRTPEGYKVIFGRLRDTDPLHYVINAACKHLFMVVDSVLEEDKTIPGFIFVFDQKGVVLGHLARINMLTVKKYFMYIQEAMPVRLKSCHVLNVSAIMSNVMTLIKPFMTKEQQDRLHLHTAAKVGDLYEEVPHCLLPEEYGGEQPSLEYLADESVKKMVAMRSWFKEDEQLRVDETKRCNNMRNSSNIFGVEGSFKKLDID